MKTSPDLARSPASVPPAPLLAELVLLLAWRPGHGDASCSRSPRFNRSLAIAMLLDLSTQKRLEVNSITPGRLLLRALGQGPIDDPLLQKIWQRVAAEPAGLEVRSGLHSMPLLGPDLAENLRQRLLARGWMQRKDHKVLGVFRSRRTEPTAAAPVVAWRDTLRQAARSETPQTAQVTSLLILLHAAGALSALFSPSEWPLVRRLVEARLNAASFKEWLQPVASPGSDDASWILLLAATAGDPAPDGGPNSSDGTSGGDGAGDGGGDGGGGSD
jgi:hypothetical protein